MFTTHEQILIKKMVWDGTVQRVVAERFRMSPATLQGVVGGYIWKGIPWPDGKYGPLSDIRRREIARMRFESSAGKIKTRHHSIAMQMAAEDRQTEIDRVVAAALLKDDGIENPTEEQIEEKIGAIRRERKLREEQKHRAYDKST